MSDTQEKPAEKPADSREAAELAAKLVALRASDAYDEWFRKERRRARRAKIMGPFKWALRKLSFLMPRRIRMRRAFRATSRRRRAEENARWALTRVLNPSANRICDEEKVEP